MHVDQEQKNSCDNERRHLCLLLSVVTIVVCCCIGSDDEMHTVFFSFVDLNYQSRRNDRVMIVLSAKRQMEENLYCAE